MMTCQRCGSEVLRKTGNQKYCTRCYHIHDHERKVAFARDVRGNVPDNGKPGFRWLYSHIVNSGRWEPDTLYYNPYR
jgi:hypothetical protein